MILFDDMRVPVSARPGPRDNDRANAQVLTHENRAQQAVGWYEKLKRG